MTRYFEPWVGNRTIAGAILCLTLTTQIRAQSAGGDPPEGGIEGFARTFLRDEQRIWTRPFHSSSYDSHTGRKYVLPFALLSAALIATDTKTGDLLPNTNDQTRWSGRVSQLGAGYTLAGFTGATWLIGQLAGDDHAKEAGLLGLEALGHTQIAVFALKQITNRQRPLDSDGKGGFWEGGNSFPSGHAASAFAVATVYAYEYRDHPLVPIATYSLAGLISASRLSARRHWVSDIAVGGSLGFLLGRFTYRRNHNPALPGTVVRRSDRLIPRVGANGAGVALSWVW